MKKKLIFGQVFLLAMTASSCGFFDKKKSRPADTSEIKEYFTHGDPMQLIEGASLNQVSPFNLDNLDQFSGFHYAGGTQFTEREEKVNPKDWDEVEESNSTEAELDAIKAYLTPTPYSFVRVSEVLYQLKPTSVDGSGLRVQFIVDQQSGQLNVDSVNATKVDMLHYSVKDDGSAFSFLMQYDAGVERGKSLLALTFADSSKLVDLPEPIGDYSYLFSNVPLKWDEPMAVDACGALSDSQKQVIENSLNEWFKDPEGDADAAAIPVSLTFKEEYGPFSDLNDNCISLVRDFKLENSDNFYIAGVALPVINRASKAIIGSDIFIFMDHVFYSDLGQANETTVHEFGHFFGLGHEFAKDEDGKASYLSIMGYSQGTDTVTTRDYKAIRDLYGSELSKTAEGS